MVSQGIVHELAASEPGNFWIISFGGFEEMQTVDSREERVEALEVVKGSSWEVYKYRMMGSATLSKSLIAPPRRSVANSHTHTH